MGAVVFAVQQGHELEEKLFALRAAIVFLTATESGSN
jgi:hypothetical protein